MTKPKNETFVKKSDKKTQKTNHIKLEDKTRKKTIQNKMTYY